MKFQSKTKRLSWSVLLPYTVGVVSLLGCSTESRRRTVVYDEAWSSTAAVRNLVCSPEVKIACQREAVEQELSLARSLPLAFQSSPKCRTVELLISTADAPIVNPTAWWLRVDFHPRLSAQPYQLGIGAERPLVGGSVGRVAVENDASDLCETVKHNGVTWYW